MRALTLIALGVCIALACGCDSEVKESLWQQISTLEKEKQELSQEVAKLKSQRRQLSEQVETLTGFDDIERKDVLPTIERISITKRTGFFDKDADNKKEKFVVYVKPYDANGDVIKAAGSVKVQLWDLSQKSGNALMNEWEITPEELAQMWMGAFMTDYYRLMFDVDPDQFKEGTEYTVKVTFTGYLSGNVFNEQRTAGLE